MSRSSQLLFLCTIALFLVISSCIPWHEEKLSHTLKSLNENELKYFANASAIANNVSFEKLLNPFLIPRLPGTSNHTIVKQHILNHMASLNWHVETDSFEDETPFGICPFETIVATLNPKTSRRLVLACHYDSKNFTNFEFIGAIDSAVSCSMLLHFATVLKPQFDRHKINSSNDVTLQFIFFDGEEALRYWTELDSIYGARHLAAKWEAQPYPDLINIDNTNYLHRMDMLILLDLLGSSTPQFHSFFNVTNNWYNELNQIEVDLRRSNYWLGPTITPLYFRLAYFPAIVEDDHIPFLTRGVHVIHMISQPFPVVWHTERDTKNNLDFDSIENLSKILRVFVSKYIHLPL